MDFELKEYRGEYEKKLIDLLLEICVDEYNLEHYREDLIEHVKNCNAKKTWILLDNEEIIATICYTERSKDIAEMKKIYIKKEYRHQGIGSKLVNMVIEHLKDMQYNSIYVGTSNHFENARKFYENLGFKFKFYEGDGYVLEKRINNNEGGYFNEI